MSLATRFALLFGLTAALTMAAVMSLALGLFDSRMSGVGASLAGAAEDAVADQMRRDSEALLAALSIDVRADLLDYDRAALDRHARGALARSSAEVVRIYDSFGRAVADGGGDTTAFETPAPAVLRGLRSDTPTIRWEEPGRMFSGRAVCIGETCIGAVAVAVDATRLEAARGEAHLRLQGARSAFLYEAATLAAAAVMLGGALAATVGWLLGRRLMASLKSAVKGLEALAAGASDIHIEAREVELRELAQAVDKVAERIAVANPEQEGILADILDGLFVANPAGRVILANPAMHELLHEPPQALVGQDVFTRFGIARPDGADAACAALGAVETVTTATGTSLPVMVSTRLGRGGERIIGIARDGSERVATEKKLMEAQLRADAAEKARTEFLAVMSHELRTPLNGVLGGAAVLAGSDLTPKQRSLLGMMQTSGKSLLTMLSNILDFSEVDSGRTTLEHVPVDLEAVAREIAASVADAAAEKGLELRLRVQPSPPMVLGDHEKLVEIGRKLVENAVRFTESGHIGIDLSHTRDSDTLKIALNVADTGIGIEPAAQAGMFGRFVQGDSSERRRHPGAGLGLTIAQRLAELMGGDLTVVSEPGRGSTFRLAIEASVVGGPAEAVPALADRRTLVVSPAEHERDTLMEQLRAAGADSSECETAAEAVAALAAALNAGKPIDLVVHPGDLADFEPSGLADWLHNEAAANPTASLVTGDVDTDGRTSGGRVQHLGRTVTGSVLFDAARRALAAVPERGGRAKRGASPLSVVADDAKATTDPAALQVLLVEGNEVNRIVLSAYLKKAGYSVEAVPTGAEALKRFKLSQPSLVLMDVDMPVMNGFDTAREFRRHEADTSMAATPIIGLTTARRDVDRDRCAAAGMNDHLPKPIKIDELEAKLDRWTMLMKSGGTPRSLAS